MNSFHQKKMTIENCFLFGAKFFPGFRFPFFLLRLQSSSSLIMIIIGYDDVDDESRLLEFGD